MRRKCIVDFRLVDGSWAFAESRPYGVRPFPINGWHFYAWIKEWLRRLSRSDKRYSVEVFLGRRLLGSPAPELVKHMIAPNSSEGEAICRALAAGDTKMTLSEITVWLAGREPGGPESPSSSTS